MNTNRHEYYLEPQNTRNCTEGVLEYSLCIHCFPWLKDNSEFGRAIEPATGVNHGKY